MRFTTFAILASLATIAASANTQGLPTCAGSCVGGFGACNSLDVKCICSSKNLIADLACCVSYACDAADQEATIKFANSICEGQGVDNLPQSATCAPGATAGTASATASSSTGTAAAAASSSASTSSAAAASSSASTSSAAGASSTSEASTASTAASSEASTASTAASSASSTVSAATGSSGAMATHALSPLGLGIAFAGVVAAL